MKRGFLKTLRMVAIVHLGLLLAFAVFPLIRGCFKPKEKQIIPVSVVFDAPEAETVSAPRQDPVRKPEPNPDRARRSIEKSDTIIRRPTKKKPELSAEDIRKRLAGDDEPRRTTTTRDPDKNAIYFEIVRRAMYQAWHQPESLAAQGLRAEARISISGDGTVTGGRIAKSSGNQVMDNSVKQALAAVKKIPGLSSAFLTQYDQITVDFELTPPTGLR